jgi:hypothetical protein
MKKLYTMRISSMMLLVFALIAIACDDNIVPTPQFSKSDAAFTATPSTTTIALAAKDSLTNAVTLTWSDPQYAVGLEKSKFSIMVGPAGKSFSSFLTKDFTGVLEGNLLAKVINAMALKFGGLIGQPTTLDLKVVASQANNNEPKSSNVVQVTVTPYGDLTLTPSATSVVTKVATSSQVGITFNWSTAFAGYNGVKTYAMQYAKGGTSFANPVNVEVTKFTKSFTQFELNKLALAVGVAAGQAGPVDFRIKAVNEAGTILYSNTATISITTYIAYNSIGIIGDATAGGWDKDTDLYRPDASKPTEWQGVFLLTGGKSAKFRADDKWDDNWGNTGFPSGTGQANGPNIPVSTTGYYKVTLDVATGAYSFTPVTTTVYTNISLIGAQSNWGSDIADLTKDPNNDQVWTGTVNLTAGELKFRANHDWAVNWGISSGTSASSLSGVGSFGGGNMVITDAGNYFVYINVATGEYFFGKTDRATPYADIGIIGSATPGGWDNDTNLVKNAANPYKWSGTITLTAGEAKFRADNDWAVNWGATGFPVGTGTSNGSNIPVSAGTYFITFNTATGEYTFLK